MNAPAIEANNVAAHNLWGKIATRNSTLCLRNCSVHEETAAKGIHSLFVMTNELMAKNPEAQCFQNLREPRLKEDLKL